VRIACQLLTTRAHLWHHPAIPHPANRRPRAGEAIAAGPRLCSRPAPLTAGVTLRDQRRDAIPHLARNAPDRSSRRWPPCPCAPSRCPRAPACRRPRTEDLRSRLSDQNCAKNCVVTHRRSPTQLTQKVNISDAGRRPPTPESGSQSRCVTGLVSPSGNVPVTKLGSTQGRPGWSLLGLSGPASESSRRASSTSRAASPVSRYIASLR
jgi:hypothetical protein